MKSTKKSILFLYGFLIFAISISAQTRQQKQTSHPSKDTILHEVLKDLADENVCGAKSDTSEVYSGTIIKREFAEDEMRISGFVLLVQKGNRVFINLDYKHISALAASASSDLSEWLIKDRKVKVYVYRYRRILYANKIVGL